MDPLLPRPPVPLHTHIVMPHLLAELRLFLLILSIKQREPRLDAPMRPGNRTRTRKERWRRSLKLKCPLREEL